MSLMLTLFNRVCKPKGTCDYPDKQVLYDAEGAFTISCEQHNQPQMHLKYRERHEFTLSAGDILVVHAYRQDTGVGEKKKSFLYIFSDEVDQLEPGPIGNELTLSLNGKVWTLTYSGASDAPMENVQVDVGMDDQ